MMTTHHEETIPVITWIIRNFILGVKGNREFFLGNTRGDIRCLAFCVVRIDKARGKEKTNK
jgi:hypothetical protein